MTYLNVRDAYRLWAPIYKNETVVSALDEELTRALSPPAEGCRLLDAGCGIGRRITRAQASFAVGVDLSLEMLTAGGRTDVVAADIRALPFSAEQFDLIWCRLVMGHLRGLVSAFKEFARVSRKSAFLLVTDFHPDAVAAGHVRSFRDFSGVVHEVEHHVGAAESAGFNPVAARAGLVGSSVECMYRRAGRMDAYERDKGLALVAGFLFQTR
jgi:malonyl-CoA O-methyltransferase